MTQSQLTLHTERNVIRDDTPSTFDIVVEINATQSEVLETGTRPLNLALVIDRSGSMSGQKLETAKSSCTSIVNRLGKDDLLSIIVFDDIAEVIVNPTVAKDEIQGKIAAISSGGSTDLASGWRLGLLELQTHGDDSHINRLILLSDGQANVGEIRRDVLERDAEHAYQLGLVSSTIGVGTDFEENLLRAIATASGGGFWFIEDTSIERIIEGEFRGALSVVYDRPRIRLALPAGVEVETPLNNLPKSINNEYRMPSLIGGRRYSYGWRLRIDPEILRSRKQNSVMVGCTVLDQGAEIQTTTQVIPLGNQEQFAVSPISSVVVEEVQKYMLATAEQEAIDLIDRGDIQGLKDLVIEMRNGMRTARSLVIDSPSVMGRMDREMEQVLDLDEVVSLLAELAEEAGLGKEFGAKLLSGDVSRHLKKLFSYKNFKHMNRSWEDSYDLEISSGTKNSILAFLLMNLGRIAAYGEFEPEDVYKIEERIRERLGLNSTQ